MPVQRFRAQETSGSEWDLRNLSGKVVKYMQVQSHYSFGGQLIAAATVVRSAPSDGLALRAAFGRTQS